jgi:stringent starvation protein A
MRVAPSRRSATTLYSQQTCPWSHSARIVLAEKGISVDVVDVTDGSCYGDGALPNPYEGVPTLVDRDFVLSDARVIIEYLDERYPHPPLMPVDPVGRATVRLLIQRVEREWYTLMGRLARPDGQEVDGMRRKMTQSVNVVAPLFAKKLFLLSDEFSLADCYVAPVLWRLGHCGVRLGPEAHAVRTYAERVFGRRAFQASLTEAERGMGGRSAWA